MKRAQGTGNREQRAGRVLWSACIRDAARVDRRAGRIAPSIPRSPLTSRFRGLPCGPASLFAPASCQRSPVPRSQSGYTLIEVIVAFGVLALGLTLLLGTLSGATRQVRHADRAGRAALHAQSLLDQAGIGESLQPGQTDGELEDGAYRWTLEVAPYRDPGAPPPGPEALAAPQLLQLVLVVSWGELPRERLRVDSLRLVAPDPLAGMGATP